VWVKLPHQPQDSTFPVGWFADPKIGRTPNSLSYPFLINYVCVRKENSMSTIAIAVIFLIRVIVPVSVLIAFGEWMRRREANYWLHK